MAPKIDSEHGGSSLPHRKSAAFAVRKVGRAIALAVFGALAFASAVGSAHAQDMPPVCEAAQRDNLNVPGAHEAYEACTIAMLACTFKEAAYVETPQYTPAINRCMDESIRAAAKSANDPASEYIRAQEGRGTRHSSRGRETGQIAVTSATYGTLEIGRVCDATSAVASACGGKITCTVNATNDLCGDPNYGTNKQLTVRFRCGNGSEQTASVREPNVLQVTCQQE